MMFSGIGCAMTFSSGVVWIFFDDLLSSSTFKLVNIGEESFPLKVWGFDKVYFPIAMSNLCFRRITQK